MILWEILMSRHRRISPSNYPQHVLNRANDGKPLFPKVDDYVRFLSLMRRTAEQISVDLYAYCLMPTHFHFVLSVKNGDDLSAYMRLLLNRHVRQHQRIHGTIGRGHIYQGRFKNFVIGDSLHLKNVLRYVESNAWRADLVEQAEHWPWSSLSALASHPERPPLANWPVPRPTGWVEYVNSTVPIFELDRIRTAVQRSRPYGPSDWEAHWELADELRHTVNRPGRPLGQDKIAVSVS
jgi:putative transposase